MPGSSNPYGHFHRKLRTEFKALIDAGGVNCCRCGQSIPPGAKFELDHADDRNGYKGAAHPFCNQSAGGAKAARNRLTANQSDDMLRCGMENPPIGTISNNGKRIKSASGSWPCLWVHRLLTSGNTS
jgi:hypothetical protein